MRVAGGSKGRREQREGEGMGKGGVSRAGVPELREQEGRGVVLALQLGTDVICGTLVFDLLGVSFSWGLDRRREDTWVMAGLETSPAPFTECKGGSLVCQELSHSASLAPEVISVGRIPSTASWTPAPRVYPPTG